MMRPRLSLVTLISVLFIRAEGQQTFQNTRFDLPANLPVEDPSVLAQLNGDTIYQNKDSLKPVKVNKSVLRLNPQPAQTVISVPSPTPTANIPPIAPFTFPSHPTFASFTLPSHPTIPSFTFPSHPTIAPFSHSTIAPFSFPTHQPPPTHPPLFSPQQFLPPSPHPFIPHGVPSIPQQPLQTLQHQFPQPFPSAPQPIEQTTLQQSSLIHQTAVPQYFINSSPSTDQHPSFYQPTPSQFSLVSQRNLPTSQPLVPQLTGQQIQQGVLQQQFLHAQHEVRQQQISQVSNVTETVQQPEQAEIPELVQPQLIQSSHIAKSEYTKVESSLQNNNGPTRTTIWFNEKHNTAACQLDLSSIGHKFKSKFPIYLQKGGKDAVLANLVEERLQQCEKKSGAGHWDKVDGLLSKISLSKSEESECRAGLIQERISCVNLLNFACQFVDPSFMFRLVPARITIQEARQAENGAEKCRKVVRLVKKRLEG